MSDINYENYIKKLEESNRHLLSEVKRLEMADISKKLVKLDEQNTLFRNCIWSISYYIKKQKAEIGGFDIPKEMDIDSMKFSSEFEEDLLNGEFTLNALKDVIEQFVNDNLLTAKDKIDNFLSTQEKIIHIIENIIADKECINKKVK